MSNNGEILQKIMEDSGMRPTVLSVPEAVFNMAKESADELGISISSWVSTAVQMIHSGQKKSPEIRTAITKQGVTIELAHRLSEIVQGEAERDRDKGR